MALYKQRLEERSETKATITTLSTEQVAKECA